MRNFLEELCCLHYGPITSILNVTNYISWYQRKAKISMVFIDKEKRAIMRDFAFLNLSTFAELTIKES